MANNKTAEKRELLLAEEIAADPDILRGKRLTAILLILWISARLLFFVMDLICAKIGFIDFNAVNIALFVLAVFFAVLLRLGVKRLPFLPLLGGLMMIASSFRDRAYSILRLDLYPEMKLYVFSYVLTAWIQTAVMLCLLLIPCCVSYAEAGGRIRARTANITYWPQLPVTKAAKKKINFRQLFGRALVMLLYLVAGGLCGLLSARYSVHLPGSFPLRLLLLLGLIYAAMALQIAIHEAGHLVFGLLTGYRFSSYRFFNLMWIRQDGKLRFKRLSLAGTGGQCLMAPSDWREDFPFVLYNLGGVLMNLISALLFWLLSRIAPPLVQLFLLTLALVGLVTALTNGLPLRIGLIDNDGRNILSIRRSPAARRAFWLQMKAHEQLAAGVRLREMPEDWFSVDGDETPENSILAAVPVNRASRLMDAHRFDEAAALQDRLIAQENLAGIYRGMLRCDRIFCELLGEGREEVLKSLLDREQQKFMTAMKNSLSVLRTQIALALLYDHDGAAAEKLKASFDRMARSYPYAADIESEKELIALAEEKAAE